jgi:hypothetical protein
MGSRVEGVEAVDQGVEGRRVNPISPAGGQMSMESMESMGDGVDGRVGGSRVESSSSRAGLTEGVDGGGAPRGHLGVESMVESMVELGSSRGRRCSRSGPVSPAEGGDGRGARVQSREARGSRGPRGRGAYRIESAGLTEAVEQSSRGRVEGGDGRGGDGRGGRRPNRTQ